jgi:hypothetical protein
MQGNRLLDAGLLLWWLGKDAPGRILLNELNRFINKLDTEQTERGQGEETLRLGILALVKFWSEYRSTISDRAKHPILDQAYNAVALVHYEVLKALLDERFRSLGLPAMPVGEPQAAAFHALTLPLSPSMFARKQIDFALDHVGPFGLGAEAIQALERFFPGMLERATPPSEVAKQIGQKLAADKQAPKLVLREYKIQKLHLASLELLGKIKVTDDKGPEQPVINEVRRLQKDPDALFRVLDDKKASKEWQDTWKRLTIETYKPQMEAYFNTIVSLSKLSEGFFSDKAALQNAYTDYAKRFVTFRHAEALTAAYLEQTTFLQKVAGGKDQANAEYEQGHLYRFATDEQPILKAGAAPKEAQLFIDLKDFTKRTFASKELAMADFMKWEFYDPILKAGKKYCLDMAHIDNNSLAINNLLGDAVLAGGSVKTLLHFAYDVLNIADSYKEKLKERMPAALVAAKLKELDEAFLKEKAALEAERNKYLAPVQKLTAEMNALPPQDPKRAQLAAQIRGYQEAAGSAARKLKQATSDHEDKRTTIEGSGLEAGAYVAYGNTAELITFKDETFGNLRVAIGEKINESARGTSRDAGVRDNLTYLVDRARFTTKNTQMEYPFRVYIDNSIHVNLDPDLENGIRKALDEKNADEVKKLVALLSQRMMSDLINNVKRETPDYRSISRGNGIYNLGLAMSGDAIDAYLKLLEGKQQVIRKDLLHAELHEEIKRRFFFPRQSYPMIIVMPDEPGSLPELYVEIGSMVFKGFEKMEPQRIYERLLDKTLFYKMLQKHHLAQWTGVPA